MNYLVFKFGVLQATKLIFAQTWSKSQEQQKYTSHINPAASFLGQHFFFFYPTTKLESPLHSQLAAWWCRWFHGLSNGSHLWLMGAKFPRIAYSSSSSSGCIQPTVQSATALLWLLCSLAQERQIGSIWRRKIRPTQTGREDKRPGTWRQRGKPEEEAFLISLNGS